METNTINQIRAQRDKLLSEIESYRVFVKSQNADLSIGQFGQESEYSLNGLVGGIKNILTDISYLVKAHDLFIKCSTYAERNTLYSNLNQLSAATINRQHQQMATYVDSLKTQLRSYNLKFDKDRYIEFNNEIDILRKKAILLEDDVILAKNKFQESSQLYDKINELKASFDASLEDINQKRDELLNEVDVFTEKFSDFENLSVSATKNETLIAEKLKNANLSEETFNEFLEQIDRREKQLETQNKRTDEYEKKLKEFTSDHDNILKEAQNLIDKSLQALHYSTAEGISTAFLMQYECANKKAIKVSWLVSAGVFIFLTLLIGVWILVGWGIDKPIADTLASIIGRLSLIPFTLLASLFCANQYIKQKNLIEDYAYKTVLAKSMIAFSEELRAKDPERYAEYLSTVLREIHQDPLRKRGKDKEELSLKDTTGIIDKIGELLKVVTKS